MSTAVFYDILSEPFLQFYWISIYASL